MILGWKQSIRTKKPLNCTHFFSNINIPECFSRHNISYWIRDVSIFMLKSILSVLNALETCSFYITVVYSEYCIRISFQSICDVTNHVCTTSVFKSALQSAWGKVLLSEMIVSDSAHTSSRTVMLEHLTWGQEITLCQINNNWKSYIFMRDQTLYVKHREQHIAITQHELLTLYTVWHSCMCTPSCQKWAARKQNKWCTHNLNYRLHCKALGSSIGMKPPKNLYPDDAMVTKWSCLSSLYLFLSSQ